jgi:2-methylisocitrate lyase-like PEP mutase family enzyme
LLPAQRLQELGFAMAIYPSLGFLAAAAALQAGYETLKRDGSTVAAPLTLYPFAQFNKLIGFEDVWAFEKTYAEVK